MEDLVVKPVETEEELRAAHAVRMRVFVQEQGVPEEEELDEYDHMPSSAGENDNYPIQTFQPSGEQGAVPTHVIAMVCGLPVGAGRVICPVTHEEGNQSSGALAPTPFKSKGVNAMSNKGEARIGRMAVDRAWRRRGIGSRVLDKLEEVARLRGADQAVLHAQTYVKSFYAAHWYVEEGQVFLEAGIEHVQMRKQL